MKKLLVAILLLLTSFMLSVNSVEAFELKEKTFIPVLVDVIGTDGAGSGGGESVSCADVGGELTAWLTNALKFIQYAGVGLAAVLTAVDFVQVIGGSKEDDLKKAFDRAVKRLIAVVLLLLTSVLVNFIITTFINPALGEGKVENCIKD